MEHFAELFLIYGYSMLFVLGIAEFLGAPHAPFPLRQAQG